MNWLSLELRWIRLPNSLIEINGSFLSSTIAAKKSWEFLWHCVILDQSWKLELQWWPPPPLPPTNVVCIWVSWTQAYSNIVLGGRGRISDALDRFSSFFGYWEILAAIVAAWFVHKIDSIFVDFFRDNVDVLPQSAGLREYGKQAMQILEEKGTTTFKEVLILIILLYLNYVMTNLSPIIAS